MRTGIHRNLLSWTLVAVSVTGTFACGNSGSDGSPNQGGTAGTPSGQGGQTGGQPSTGGGSAMSGGGQVETAGTGSVLPGGGSSSMSGSGSGGVVSASGSGGTPSTGGGAAGTGMGGSTASSGCGKAAGLMNGRASIDVSGTMREYILALPNNYDPNHAYKLIFGWHPLGGSAQQVAGGGYYGLQKESKDQAILVSPEGLPFQGNSLGWGNKNGEDLDFLQAMLDLFRSKLCVDEDRIFSTGFSFGGMMSFAVGCSSMSMMRAIAPMAGNTMVSGCENGTRPVAMMGFHGTHDSVVDISGGQKGRDVFVKRNGCTMDTMPTQPSWCDGLSQNYQPCSCVSYQGCMAGYPVIWCEYNADHMAAPTSGATLWNFFSQF